VLHAPRPRLAQARRTAGGASPVALRAGTTAPRVPSSWPVTNIQNTITKLRFVPTGRGSVSAHNRLIRRYTTSCIGWSILVESGVRSSLYSDGPPGRLAGAY